MEIGYEKNDSRNQKRELLLVERKNLPKYTVLKKEENEENPKTKALILSQELMDENDVLTLSLENDLTTDLAGIRLRAGVSSRCVSVDTTLTTPDGRSVKKASNTKSEIIKFRCSSFEKKLLKNRANKCNLTLSEYFRRVAFEQKIIERLTEDEIMLYKMMLKYHNNFKAIGNMFRKKNPQLTQEVYDLANTIKSHLKKFSS